MSPLPLEPTYSVSQLCGEIRELLSETFANVWMVGEVQRVKQSPRGHVYFELIEKGDDDAVVGKLDAVMWASDHQRVRRVLAASDQRLSDGVQIRCRGSLDFYGPSGRVQVTVREIDPTFTLGLLEKRRRETLAALAAAGLMERNRALALPDLPLTVALITSDGSAAYHDFLSGLRASGYGFRVLFVHAAVQGRDAERQVASALALLASTAGGRIDCAVLIRGGGARTDLAAFDSRIIAEAIAHAPFPVLTGLGHEIDRSIADLVAHTSLKTPTMAAEFLIERISRLELAVAELERTLLREALRPIAQAREALGRAQRGVSLARVRLTGAGARLAEHARTLARLGRSALRIADRRGGEARIRLLGAAPRLLERAERDRRHRGERAAGAARGHLRTAGATLQGIERLIQQLDPQRTLERGWSITRDAGGRLLRHPGQVEAGTLLISQLAGGLLHSRAEGAPAAAAAGATGAAAAGTGNSAGTAEAARTAGESRAARTRARRPAAAAPQPPAGAPQTAAAGDAQIALEFNLPRGENESL